MKFGLGKLFGRREQPISLNLADHRHPVALGKSQPAEQQAIEAQAARDAFKESLRLTPGSMFGLSAPTGVEAPKAPPPTAPVSWSRTGLQIGGELRAPDPVTGRIEIRRSELPSVTGFRIEAYSPGLTDRKSDPTDALAELDLKVTNVGRPVGLQGAYRAGIEDHDIVSTVSPSQLFGDGRPSIGTYNLTIRQGDKVLEKVDIVLRS
jgi:hypothetical protein